MLLMHPRPLRAAGGPYFQFAEITGFSAFW
jgi:hypothetical protein